METILIAVVVLLIVIALLYNFLISRKNQVDNIFAGVDAVLKKRYDLIPNLISSVKQYMTHERELLQNITKLRAQAMNPSATPDTKVALDTQITKALGSIMVAVENYPDLKANENIMHLQATLNEIEEQISAARRAYNQAVTDYHNAIEMFPSNILAGSMNLHHKELFEISQTERKNVDVGKLFNS